MNLKIAVFSLFFAATVAAYPASGEQCSLAVVSRQLPSTTKVCDAKTVSDLARHGQVFEQNQMGLASMLVIGPGSDIKTSIAWFEKAAQQGYAPAQVNLAVIYANGWGVPQNYGVALRWLREAADRRYPAAYYNLGELYFKGTGVRQDYPEALRFFRLGADAGDTPSQTNLAYMYDRGLGVEANLQTAISWYRKAADAGDPMAQSNLADLYARGEGVPHDDAMAFHLFQKAAAKGHTGAQIQLAYRMSRGIGTAKDAQSALAWVTAAVLAGDNRGQELLQSLQLQLKPDQIKRAHETAINFRASGEQAAKAAMLQP